MSKPTCWKTCGCSSTLALLRLEGSEIEDDRHHEDQRRATERTGADQSISAVQRGGYGPPGVPSALAKLILPNDLEVDRALLAAIPALERDLSRSPCGMEIRGELQQPTVRPGIRRHAPARKPDCGHWERMPVCGPS